MKKIKPFLRTAVVSTFFSISVPISYCQTGSNSTHITAKDPNVGKIMELELNGSLTYVEGGVTYKGGIAIVDPSSQPTYRGSVKNGNDIYIVSGIPNADGRKIEHSDRWAKVYLTVKIRENNTAEYLSYRIN